MKKKINKQTKKPVDYGATQLYPCINPSTKQT